MKSLLLFGFLILLVGVILPAESQAAMVAEADDGPTTDISAPPPDPCLKNSKLPQCK